MDKHKVIIAIDDLHPEEGWGCEGDESVKYLEELNREFGCKFTLFIPSNYHGKYPLSKHKDWVDFWKKKDWVELAAHGHYHKCERTDIGECEFFELDTEEKAMDRVRDIINEWFKVQHKCDGWRNPGWLAHPEAVKVIGNYFKYAALHEEHNRGLQWNCEMHFGCDGINESENLNMYNEKFIFQSHIAGDWNDNVWNEENYENFRNVLSYLSENYKLEYKTFNQIKGV